ncbi:uroporphyrinogen decarboxylase family protein, partial [Bacteroidota bacterium]
RENFLKTLNHEQPEKLVVDFGATPVTGIHTLVIEKLREYFGLEKRPVKVTEAFQWLGEVEEDLLEALGVDVIGIIPPYNAFGHRQENWKEYRTIWGQEVLVPAGFNTTVDGNGDVLIYPQGDLSVPPSAKMPKTSYFFDALIRQSPIDDARLNPEDNLEEYSLMKTESLEYFRNASMQASKTDKGIIINVGGTHIGNIAFVPGNALKHPKGIRDVADWYMSLVLRPDYLHQVFDKQTDIAVQNLAMVKEVTGDCVDAIYMCGTDFGTQTSSFCSTETFAELFKPYYKKMNDWIHENTRWKTFKHSCGAVEPFMDHFIEAGFDIINPVQVNAAGMDPVLLKKKYGDKLVFWGGGADTQKILPFSTPEEIKAHVLKECEIFSPEGGFVFNTVHNIQANVPIENVLAMLDALRQFG